MKELWMTKKEIKKTVEWAEDDPEELPVNQCISRGNGLKNEIMVTR